MTRRSWLLFLLPFTACRSHRAMPADLFPETTPGGWRRVSIGDVTGVSDPVPADAVEQSRAARYEGPGALEAHVYQLTSPSVGLDIAQRWRPSADTVFFNRGVYFVVVKWQSADRAALQEFVRTLENRLPKEGS